MDFTVDQSMAISKAIIEVTDHQEALILFRARHVEERGLKTA